jgi:hypothetical protein
MSDIIILSLISPEQKTVLKYRVKSGGENVKGTMECPEEMGVNQTWYHFQRASEAK